MEFNWSWLKTQMLIRLTSLNPELYQVQGRVADPAGVNPDPGGVVPDPGGVVPDPGGVDPLAKRFFLRMQNYCSI